MKKLGYEVEKPTVCKTIVGKRVCGLKEGEFSKKRKARVYRQNKLFTKIIYYLRRPKIISLTKKKDYVIVVKRAKQWVRKTIKVNQKLRTNIANIAFAQQYRYKYVFEYIQKTIRKMEHSKRRKLRRYLREKTGRRIIIRKIIEKRFGPKLRNSMRTILNSKIIKELAKTQYKPLVTKKVFPTRLTKIAIKLPAAILKLDNKDLIKLLEIKARSKK